MKRTTQTTSKALMIAACISGAAAPTQAAVKVWTSTATGGTIWSDTANWNNTGAPVSGDSLAFGTPVAGGSRSPVNDIVGLSLVGINVSGNAYNITGNAVTMNGDVAFTAGGTNASTITPPLILGQAINIDVAATTGSGRLELNGDVSGNFGVTKTGTGMLRLGAVTKTYTGDTNLSAGTIDIVAGQSPSGAGKGNLLVNTGATFNLNNNSASINGLNNGALGGGAVNKGGSGTRSLTLGLGDANGSFSGTFAFGGGNSNINKNGTGTQVLSGAGTFTPTGNTFVAGGRLILDGAWGSSVVVAAAGNLGGTGTLSPTGTIATTVNGGLNPGGTLSGATFADSTAVLTHNGNVILAGTAVTAMDIDGLARETQYDGLDVLVSGTQAGTLTYGGTLNIDFASDLIGVFDLFNGVTTAGSFSAINLTGAVTGSLTNDGAGIWTGSAGSNTYVFTQATGDLLVIVPEPTTLGLLAGVATFGLRRRRA